MNPPNGLAIHSLAVSLLVFLLFGVITTLVYFLRMKTLDRSAGSIPLTNNERSLGWQNIRFIPARLYARWRNPMRNLRRSLSWPSSRRWRSLRKTFRTFLTSSSQRIYPRRVPSSIPTISGASA